MSSSEQNGAQGRNDEIVRHLPRLLWRARALVRNDADASDLVQDTVEKALRAWPRLRPGSNVGAWLETLLSHTFVDGWRWASRRTNHVSTTALDLAAPEPHAPPPWLELGDADVRAAVARLPAEFAAIFRMRVFERLSYREISRRLGIPSGTVGTRLQRARQRLRDVLLAEMPQRPNLTILRPAGAPQRRAANATDARPDGETARAA